MADTLHAATMGGHHHHGHAHSPPSNPYLASVYQLIRPSPHSYIIMLSHVSFLLCITAAVRRGLILESISLTVSCLISLLYHLCDENLYCAMGVDIYGWHAADVWSTFFLICFVMGVMMLDIRSPLLKLLLRCCYFVVVTLFVWIDPGNMLLLGSLLIAVASSVVVRYSFFPPEPRSELAEANLHLERGQNVSGKRRVEDGGKSDTKRASVVDGGATATGRGVGSAKLVNRNRKPSIEVVSPTVADERSGGDVSFGAALGSVDDEDNMREDAVTNGSPIMTHNGKVVEEEVTHQKQKEEGKMKKPKSAAQIQRERYLAIALGIFSFALACFVVANTPVVGPETYQVDIHGPKKPMDVPDTAVYWVFHSVWHFSSAIAGYFMVKFLTD